MAEIDVYSYGVEIPSVKEVMDSMIWADIDSDGNVDLGTQEYSVSSTHKSKLGEEIKRMYADVARYLKSKNIAYSSIQKYDSGELRIDGRDKKGNLINIDEIKELMGEIDRKTLEESNVKALVVEALPEIDEETIRTNKYENIYDIYYTIDDITRSNEQPAMEHRYVFVGKVSDVGVSIAIDETYTRVRLSMSEYNRERYNPKNVSIYPTLPFNKESQFSKRYEIEEDIINACRNSYDKAYMIDVGAVKSIEETRNEALEIINGFVGGRKWYMEVKMGSNNVSIIVNLAQYLEYDQTKCKGNDGCENCTINGVKKADVLDKLRNLDLGEFFITGHDMYAVIVVLFPIDPMDYMKPPYMSKQMTGIYDKLKQFEEAMARVIDAIRQEIKVETVWDNQAMDMAVEAIDEMLNYGIRDPQTIYDRLKDEIGVPDLMNVIQRRIQNLESQEFDNASELLEQKEQLSEDVGKMNIEQTPERQLPEVEQQEIIPGKIENPEKNKKTQLTYVR